MEATLFRISLWSFFGGMIVHFLGLWPREGTRAGRVFQGLATALIVAGFGALTVMITQRWISQGRVPISSSYEYLSVLSWFVAVLYLSCSTRCANP